MNNPLLKNVIVVTGTIGSGKTTACEILAKKGAAVVSADELAREVVKPGSPALLEIAKTFGDSFIHADGSLNRQELGECVFNDPTALRRLEAILHPQIARLAEERLTELVRQAQHEIVLYDCPLYFEAGLESRGFGAVLLIDADEAVALARVAERDSLDAEAIKDRMRNQIPAKDKRSKATFVIDNSGTREQLESQIDSLYTTLISIGKHYQESKN